MNNNTGPSPEQSSATSEDIRQQLQNGQALLTERERMVLELRFGLRDERAFSRVEIGRSLGVSKERIRQIELRALNRLRHPNRGKLNARAKLSAGPKPEPD